MTGDEHDVDERPDDSDPTCSRCGGEPVTVRSGGVQVRECADCGNVLGLSDADLAADDREDGPVRTGEVTATDGELGQLVALLRAEGTAEAGAGPSVTAGRLLIATDAATLEIRAADGDVEIREVDGQDD